MAPAVGDPDAAIVVPNHKTGTWVTGTMHIFCAVVGAGVLGLPWAVGTLGWVAGPLLVTVFYAVARWASVMLSQVYQVDGLEHARYHHAVHHILGHKGAITASVFQIINLVLLCLAYLIIGAESMNYIAVTLGSGFYKQYQMTLVMGAVEVVLSQLPNLEEAWWVSLLGSAMSLLYCSVALILGCVYANAGQGTVSGISGQSPAKKAFDCLNALGSIGFAYGVSNVLLEVTDTLKQPPSAVKAIQKSINIALTTAFFFYLTVSCTGYASLGNATPGLVLNGFTDAPTWVVVLANFAIVLHMMSAWQVFAQPCFDTVESWVKSFRIHREQHKGGRGTAAGAFRPGVGTISEGRSGSPGASTPSKPCSVAEELGSPFVKATAEGGGQAAPLDDGPLGSRHLSVRSRGNGTVARNSCPIPDLIPSHGWDHRERFVRRIKSLNHCKPVAADSPHLKRSGSSFMHMALLQRSSMFCTCPGVANEHVPLNQTGYLLPLHLRICIRTAFVLLMTVIGVVLPFILSFTGLIGGLCWFPLTIAFPMLMWKKVYKPRGMKLWVMWIVGVSMFCVALAATTGSVYTMIDSLRHVTWFE